MSARLSSVPGENHDRDARGDPQESLLQTSDLIGKKWRPVIVGSLLEQGELGFNELQSTIEGISSKVLSDNLVALEEAGLLTREIAQQKPVRVEYTLTPAGEALRPLIEAMREWGEPNGPLAEP